VETLSQGSDVVGEKRNSQILVNLPITDVPRGTSSDAKTLALKHLKIEQRSGMLPYMGVERVLAEPAVCSSDQSD
jgi:hypothetical protein